VYTQASVRSLGCDPRLSLPPAPRRRVHTSPRIMLRTPVPALDAACASCLPQVAVHFADLHDKPGRMTATKVVREVPAGARLLCFASKFRHPTASVTETTRVLIGRAVAKQPNLVPCTIAAAPCGTHRLPSTPGAGTVVAVLPQLAARHTFPCRQVRK
jgi:hypothetical protein